MRPCLGLGLHLLCGLLVLRLVDELAPTEIAVAFALYFVSRPLALREALNGQETALALFVLLVWARRALEWERGQRKQAGGLLLWALLLPWARTDLLVIAFGFVVAKQIFRLVERRGVDFGLVELSAAASALLYVLGQRVFFGAWLPPSGFAVPWLFQTVFAEGQPTFAETLRRIWWYVRPVLLGGPYMQIGFGFGVAICALLLAPLVRVRRWFPLLLCAFAALAGAQDFGAVLVASLLLVPLGTILLELWSLRSPVGGLGRHALGFVLGFVLLLVLHLPIRWYPRDYYFVPGVLAGLVVLSAFASRLMVDHGLIALVPRERRLSLLLVVTLVFLPFDRGFAVDRFPWQEEMRFAARATRALIGDEARVGAFNAGLLAWESDGKNVRNLDGVVDGASIPALRERKLAFWLDDEGVEWVLDTPRQVGDADPDRIAPHASGRFMGPLGSRELVPRVIFDLPRIAGQHPGTEVQVLYARRGSEAERESFGEVPRVLGRDAQGAWLLLDIEAETGGGDATAIDYVLEVDGRQSPLRFDDSSAATRVQSSTRSMA